MKPPHTDTIELSREDMERGAREETYAQRIRQWRAGDLSDEALDRMRKEDPDFSRYCWQMGMP